MGRRRTHGAGQSGQAFRVEGNGFINVKGVQPPEWNQPFSFGCWVKPDAGNANGALFSKMDEGNAYRGFDLWLQQGSVGTPFPNGRTTPSRLSVSQSARQKMDTCVRHL